MTRPPYIETSAPTPPAPLTFAQVHAEVDRLAKMVGKEGRATLSVQDSNRLLLNVADGISGNPDSYKFFYGNDPAGMIAEAEAWIAHYLTTRAERARARLAEAQREAAEMGVG